MHHSRNHWLCKKAGSSRTSRLLSMVKTAYVGEPLKHGHEAQPVHNRNTARHGHRQGARARERVHESGSRTYYLVHGTPPQNRRHGHGQAPPRSTDIRATGTGAAGEGTWSAGCGGCRPGLAIYIGRSMAVISARGQLMRNEPSKHEQACEDIVAPMNDIWAKGPGSLAATLNVDNPGSLANARPVETPQSIRKHGLGTTKSVS